jgi:hypothetical protein
MQVFFSLFLLTLSSAVAEDKTPHHCDCMTVNLLWEPSERSDPSHVPVKYIQFAYAIGNACLDKAVRVNKILIGVSPEFGQYEFDEQPLEVWLPKKDGLTKQPWNYKVISNSDNQKTAKWAIEVTVDNQSFAPRQDFIFSVIVKKWSEHFRQVHWRVTLGTAIETGAIKSGIGTPKNCAGE